MAIAWQALSNVIPPSDCSGGASSHRRWTGFHTVDSLFVDGWPDRMVIEIVGGSGSGKTQLCMAAVVAAASTGATVLAIDTCNGITQTRLLELVATARNIHQPSLSAGQDLQRKASVSSLLKDSATSDILSRIYIARARDPWTLLDLLARAVDDSPVPHQEAPPRYDMVVVDSLQSVFASYLQLQLDPAHGAAASVDALASSAGLMFRRLAAQGCTVLVTNAPPPTPLHSSGPRAPPRQQHSQQKGPSALHRLHGPLTAALSDIFDAVIDASAAHGPAGPAVRLEIVTRPPYYIDQPSVAVAPIAHLCTGSRAVAPAAR